jgi:hypothetical protein
MVMMRETEKEKEEGEKKRRRERKHRRTRSLPRAYSSLKRRAGVGSRGKSRYSGDEGRGREEREDG